MASVKMINNKKGISYKITVSCGYDKNGKKLVKTTTYRPDPNLTQRQQKKALQRYVIEYEDKIKNGDCFDGEKLYFEEYADKWLEYMVDNLAYSTYTNYKRMLDLKIIPYFKGYKLAKIKTPLIENFYKLLSEDYAYASIKKCANILSGMFKTAIRWQMIDNNPCTNAIIPKNIKKETKIKYFTPQQSLMFLKSLDLVYETTYKAHQRVDDTGKPYYVNDYIESHKVSTQYKVFYYISLFCVLRKSETLALHWDDIDFDQKQISVTKSVSTSKEGVTYKEPKTYASIRTVEMPEQLIPILKQYRKEYNVLRLSLGDSWKGDGNLFIQSDGKLMGMSTTYHYFVRHIERYNEWVKNNKEDAEKQGLEELPRIPLHGLRHSCATLLNYLDISIIDISGILGHAQSSTTMNIYTHSFEKQKRTASNKIEEFVRMNA